MTMHRTMGQIEILNPNAKKRSEAGWFFRALAFRLSDALDHVLVGRVVRTTHTW
jgi:hypothetical protein